MIPAPKINGKYEFRFAEDGENVRFFGLTEDGRIVPLSFGGNCFLHDEKKEAMFDASEQEAYSFE